MIFPDGLEDIQIYTVLQAQREIGVQIKFALTTFENITKKGEGNFLITFSSIHSFLTHCANISKLLEGEAIKAEIGKSLAEALKTPDLPNLNDRRFRNDLDHFDERMVNWIKIEYPKHKNLDPKRRPVSDLTIGQKEKMGGSNVLHLRNYDAQMRIYTFGDRDINLGRLLEELIILQEFIGAPKFERL